jgi:hypothetical protein
VNSIDGANASADEGGESNGYSGSTAGKPENTR